MAKKINYDEKIATLEQKIEKKAAQISALKTSSKSWKQKAARKNMKALSNLSNAA